MCSLSVNITVGIGVLELCPPPGPAGPVYISDSNEVSYVHLGGSYVAMATVQQEIIIIEDS